MVRAANTTVAVAVAAAWTAPAQAAVEPVTFSDRTPVDPTVITDLPCLEGTEFVLAGTASVLGHLIDTGSSVHGTVQEAFESTWSPWAGRA